MSSIDDPVWVLLCDLGYAGRNAQTKDFFVTDSGKDLIGLEDQIRMRKKIRKKIPESCENGLEFCIWCLEKAGFKFKNGRTSLYWNLVHVVMNHVESSTENEMKTVILAGTLECDGNPASFSDFDRGSYEGAINGNTVTFVIDDKCYTAQISVGSKTEKKCTVENEGVLKVHWEE